MRLCNFSSVTKIIAENISHTNRLNQTEFFTKLFNHFSEQYPNYDYDNGNINRWISRRNVSSKFAAFYENDENKRYLSEDIEKNIFPFLYDIFFVVDEIYNLIISDTTISCKKKIEILKNYPCENTKIAAKFLGDCIIFTFERKEPKFVSEEKENDISNAYNQLVFAIENFKNYADEIMRRSEVKNV